MVRVACAVFRVVFDSRSSFFAPKPHGNACYAGYPRSLYSHPHANLLHFLACVAGAWKQWAQKRTGARKGDTRGERRVSLSRARSFFRSLLPSACYPGYSFSCQWSAPGLGLNLAKCLDPLLKILDPLRSKMYFVYIICRSCTTCMPFWEWSYSVV